MVSYLIDFSGGVFWSEYSLFRLLIFPSHLIIIIMIIDTSIIVVYILEIYKSNSVFLAHFYSWFE